MMTRRLAPLSGLLLAAITLAGCHARVQAPTAQAPVGHVFVLVLENEDYKESFGSHSPAPYLAQTLPAQGALLKNYYGTGHHSLDNYISMISGQAPNPETQLDCHIYSEFEVSGPNAPPDQVVGQGCVYPAKVPTLASQLEQAGLSWKGYMEDMGKTPPANRRAVATRWSAQWT